MTTSSANKYKKRFDRLSKSCKVVYLFIDQSNLYKEYLRLISYSSQKFSVPQERGNLIRSNTKYTGWLLCTDCTECTVRTLS